MAATYSSFMTTRFYSPAFNTALFDGPLRIYFSQSYESAALKIYHLLQTEHAALWARLKNFSHSSKEHAFLMIYPERQDLDMIFNSSENLVTQEWEEGLALGMCQPGNEEDLQTCLQSIAKSLTSWVQHAEQTEISYS